MIAITHEDGGFTVERDDFTDGADELRTVAIEYERGGSIYVPVEIAEQLAAAITAAAAAR